MTIALSKQQPKNKNKKTDLRYYTQYTVQSYYIAFVSIFHHHSHLPVQPSVCR